NQFLVAKNNIVITKSLAEKFFGNSSALNKILKVHTTDSTFEYFAISNVIEDLPATSHLQVDAIIPIPEHFPYNLETNFGVILGPTYLQLKPGTHVNELQDRLTASIHEKNKFLDMRLQPVKTVHTDSMDMAFDLLNNNKIDGKYIRIFAIVGLAIFLVACINF